MFYKDNLTLPSTAPFYLAKLQQIGLEIAFCKKRLLP